MKIKRNNIIYTVDDKLAAADLIKHKKDLQVLRDNPVPKPAAFDKKEPEMPREPETYENRVTNLHSYGVGWVDPAEVAAEFIEYSNKLDTYNSEKKNFDRQKNLYNQKDEVIKFKAYENELNKIQKQINQCELLQESIKVDEIILESTDIDSNGELTLAVKQDLLKVGLSQDEINELPVLVKKSRVCVELLDLCKQYESNPYLSKLEKAYVKKAVVILTQNDVSHDIKLSRFVELVSSPPPKTGRTEAFLLFLKKSWHIIKNFSLFKDTKNKKQEINAQYRQQGTFYDNVRNQQNFQDQKADIIFIRNKAEAEKKFIELFQEHLGSKQQIDEAVERRMSHANINFSDMEKAGYFNEDGSMKNEFKNSYDLERMKEEVADNFGLHNLSDKQCIVLASLYFQVNTKVTEHMQNSQAEVVAQMAALKNIDKIPVLRSRLDTYAKIASHSDLVKKYLEDNKQKILEDIDNILSKSPGVGLSAN